MAVMWQEERRNVSKVSFSFFNLKLLSKCRRGPSHKDGAHREYSTETLK